MLNISREIHTEINSLEDRPVLKIGSVYRIWFFYHRISIDTFNGLSASFSNYVMREESRR